MRRHLPRGRATVALTSAALALAVLPLTTADPPPRQRGPPRPAPTTRWSWTPAAPAWWSSRACSA